MKHLIALTALLISAASYSAPPATIDLPREVPATATGFLKCENGRQMVVAVIFTYPSGKFVRVDLENMHGLESAQELIEYARSAPDQKVYGIDCEARTAT